MPFIAYALQSMLEQRFISMSLSARYYMRIENLESVSFQIVPSSADVAKKNPSINFTTE